MASILKFYIYTYSNLKSLTWTISLVNGSNIELIKESSVSLLIFLWLDRIKCIVEPHLMAELDKWLF